MKNILKPAVAATALAITAFSGAATAMPFEQLYFSQSAGWVDPTTDSDAATGFFGEGSFNMVPAPTNCPDSTGPAGTSPGMQWTGSSLGSDTSSICIISFDSTSSNVGFAALNEGSDDQWNVNEYWVIDELIQENRVISGGPFPSQLWLADTLADFYVYSDSVGGTELIGDPGSTTRISFWESLNVDDWDDCNPDDPYNVLGPVAGAGPCADRYRVALGEFAEISSGPVGGYIYTIEFTLFPGPVSSTLNGPELTTTIVDYDDPNFIDVYTPEIAPGFSRLFVAARWSVREVSVPEPSVLALFGAGLFGLGLANRRRKQRN